MKGNHWPVGCYPVSLFCSYKHCPCNGNAHIQTNTRFSVHCHCICLVCRCVYHYLNGALREKFTVLLSIFVFTQTEIQSQTALSHNFFIFSAALLLPGRKLCPEKVMGKLRLNLTSPYLFPPTGVSWAWSWLLLIKSVWKSNQHTPHICLMKPGRRIKPFDEVNHGGWWLLMMHVKSGGRHKSVCMNSKNVFVGGGWDQRFNHSPYSLYFEVLLNDWSYWLSQNE